MILIADSGSTKTDWCLIHNKELVKCVHTQGINPLHQSEETIRKIISEELLSELHNSSLFTSHSSACIFFYGSGCNAAYSTMLKDILTALIPTAQQINVHSDLLAAARAVCGTSYGIACIMGTGANSCLYDGNEIIKNTPPLGYILGDEGSGAALGKRFLNAIYKGFLTEDLRKKLESHLEMNYQNIITRIYRQPMANRFLASLAPFIKSNIQIPAVRTIVINNFRDFFRRNIVQYQTDNLPIGAVGSIAYYFRDELCEAADEEGFMIGNILRSPIKGLVAYHTTEQKA